MTGLQCSCCGGFSFPLSACKHLKVPATLQRLQLVEHDHFRSGLQSSQTFLSVSRLRVVGKTHICCPLSRGHVTIICNMADMSKSNRLVVRNATAAAELRCDAGQLQSYAAPLASRRAAQGLEAFKPSPAPVHCVVNGNWQRRRTLLHSERMASTSQRCYSRRQPRPAAAA